MSETDTVHTHGPSDLFVHILGVAMLLPDVKKVVLVDGRMARPSVADPKTVIPAHLPIIAVARKNGKPCIEKHEHEKSRLTFVYDMGHGPGVRFDAYLLDGHTVTFENVVHNHATVDDNKIASMGDLCGHLRRCGNLGTGNAKEVVGTIELANADKIEGKPHGPHSSHTLKFGQKEDAYHEKIEARFVSVEGKHPVIRLKSATDEKTIPICEEGPWDVLVANVPAEEILNLNPPLHGHAIPLAHIELIYDLYHAGPNDHRPVPTCSNHHPASQSLDGHCGPPVKP